MIPPGVDIANLAAQLREDRVAYSNVELSHDTQLNTAVAQQLHPDEGLAVVDVYPDKVADLRDIAQDLKNASGLDTVIVQAPLNVSAVSDTYSRSEIESTQEAIAPGTDQIALVQQFHAGIVHGDAPIVAVVVLALVVAAVCAAVAFRCAAGTAYSTLLRARRSF